MGKEDRLEERPGYVGSVGGDTPGRWLPSAEGLREAELIAQRLDADTAGCGARSGGKSDIQTSGF
jgi:hypothetical protein